MAEEAQYDSATNKRKYEDNTPSPAAPGRRQTGFSAPLSSQSPPNAAAPGSYNSVPPPMEEIQLAKQKAQEIAARLFNNAADPTKRPRVDNGDPNDYQKSFSSVVTPPISGSYGGYPGPSKRIEIPNGRVGVIIGKAGETIKYLQTQSGAKIQVTRDTDADPHAPTRGVELTGTPEEIAKAEQFIKDVLAEAESGGSGISSRRATGQQYGSEQYTTKIPNNKVGLVIGKGGETIKSMQAKSGARIQVIPLHLPPGDPSTERTLQIDGTSEEIEAAKQMVNEVISENRVRNSSMGGYSQQGYQARPPTNWAPQGAPMQQQQQQGGYGYMPPSAYPGQPPQYNTSQPSYPGYPPQPASGGYSAAGWDQTSAASNQQPAQGGGAGSYDYYSQPPPAQHQQAPGAPTDGSGGAAAYGYGQPGYGQGYGGQDGYGGYPQSGYGYDQQGYNTNSGSGYGGNASSNTTPPPDGQTAPAASYGAQGDSNTTNTQPPPQVVQSSGYPTTGQQQPSPNPNPSYPPAQTGYGMPPTSQGGYGTQPPYGGAGGYGPPSYGAPPPQKVPTSQPPPYGQPQQSPGTQGYAQPGGYPPAQSGGGGGYAQPDSSSAHRPPSSGYGAPGAQPGYGYGAVAPPGSQPGYGQQQAPPSAGYNAASYGGGYSQPAAAAYDAAAPPPSQSSQPAAKASPQS